MKKTLFSLFLITGFLACSQTLAEKQQAKQKVQAQGITSKPVYVVLYNEHDDEDFLKHLTKKHKDQELANYIRFNSTYNTFIKKAVDDMMLTMFPSVKYITFPEYKKIRGKALKSVNIIVRGFAYQITYGSPGGGQMLVEPRTEQVKFDTLNVKQKPVVRFKTYMSNIGISTFDIYCEKQCDQLFFQEAEIRSAILNIKWKLEGDLKK